MRTAAVALSSMMLASTMAAAEPDRPSPAFSILRVGAPTPAPLALSQYRGKIVALVFIDTGCPHCQELTAILKPIAQEYAPRGVRVLECAFNDNAERLVPEFIARFQPPFPVGWNNRLAVMSYLQHSILDPRPLYVPHMVFLDRRGVIRGDFPGEDSFFKDANANVRAELDKLLKAGAEKTAARKK
ncbi:MAG: TlpA family protein disulfide reductase [Acidobacteriia bacterium]|nr:TlpA family protein disulfide reductase [Terriglobia bacterium]